MTARRVSVLGSTGSVGQNTLDIIRRAEPGEFEVVALTANNNAELLAKQALEFGADFVALASENNAKILADNLNGWGGEIGVGPDALKEASRRPADFVMASIIGAAGLEPTLEAVKQGAHIGLANKESLVCAGDLVMSQVKAYGAVLLPVDSEHNAIFQVLDTERPKGVKRLILTASGGPFLNTSMTKLRHVKAKDALNHPIWDMGAKITIDSATMMNKGLELIEASYLFDRPSSEIDVIIHPQSVVHSMVEYVDGSVLAQMGSPDMRTPIAYSLAWPARMQAPVESLDLVKISKLTFFEPDLEKFRSLRIAREALEAGGQATNILNAANELAVGSFLKGRIGYLDIPIVAEDTLNEIGNITENKLDLDEILAIDAMARQTATGVIKRLSARS